jgi:hypothetical protein
MMSFHARHRAVTRTRRRSEIRIQVRAELAKLALWEAGDPEARSRALYAVSLSRRTLRLALERVALGKAPRNAERAPSWAACSRDRNSDEIGACSSAARWLQICLHIGRPPSALASVQAGAGRASRYFGRGP